MNIFGESSRGQDGEYDSTLTAEENDDGLEPSPPKDKHLATEK
jgi:hypothetical protein